MDPTLAAAFLLIGAVSGLLAGLLGVGGGAIIVPALIWLFGATAVNAQWIPHQAIATSLATIAATGTASARAHHRRDAVRGDLLPRLVPGLLLGAWIGAAVAGGLPESWLQRLFAVFLLLNAVQMLRTGVAEGAERGMPVLPALIGFGALFGALSALLGIGGGILLVPFLARRGLPMRTAVGTSSACGVPLAVAGTLGYIAHGWGREGLLADSVGFVHWPAALAIIAASVPMATVGAALAHRLQTRTLKQIFGVLLGLVGVDLLIS